VVPVGGARSGMRHALGRSRAALAISSTLPNAALRQKFPDLVQRPPSPHVSSSEARRVTSAPAQIGSPPEFRRSFRPLGILRGWRCPPEPPSSGETAKPQPHQKIVECRACARSLGQTACLVGRLELTSQTLILPLMKTEVIVVEDRLLRTSEFSCDQVRQMTNGEYTCSST